MIYVGHGEEALPPSVHTGTHSHTHTHTQGRMRVRAHVGPLYVTANTSIIQLSPFLTW